MTLFDKNKCNACGKKRGLLNFVTLKDGTILCTNCAKKAAFQGCGFKYDLHKELYEMDFNEYRKLLESRNKNLERLKSFQRSKSFCQCVQIDEGAKEILFIKNSHFERKELLYKSNPQIFGVEDLILHKPIYYISSDVRGRKNKYVIADIDYFVGVKHSFVNGFKLKIRKRAKCDIKKVVGKTVIFTEKKVDELQNYLTKLYFDKMKCFNVIEKMQIEDRFEELYFQKVKLAKEHNYFEAEEISILLHIFFHGNAQKIKEAREKYGFSN